MLRLVGGPNDNTLPLTPSESVPREHGFPMSGSMAFICLLRHVCLATLRAVITPAW